MRTTFFFRRRGDFYGFDNFRRLRLKLYFSGFVKNLHRIRTTIQNRRFSYKRFPKVFFRRFRTITFFGKRTNYRFRLCHRHIATKNQNDAA